MASEIKEPDITGLTLDRVAKADSVRLHVNALGKDYPSVAFGAGGMGRKWSSVQKRDFAIRSSCDELFSYSHHDLNGIESELWEVFSLCECIGIAEARVAFQLLATQHGVLELVETCIEQLPDDPSALNMLLFFCLGVPNAREVDPNGKRIAEENCTKVVKMGIIRKILKVLANENEEEIKRQALNVLVVITIVMKREDQFCSEIVSIFCCGKPLIVFLLDLIDGKDGLCKKGMLMVRQLLLIACEIDGCLEKGPNRVSARQNGSKERFLKPKVTKEAVKSLYNKVEQSFGPILDGKTLPRTPIAVQEAIQLVNDAKSPTRTEIVPNSQSERLYMSLAPRLERYVTILMKCLLNVAIPKQFKELEVQTVWGSTDCNAKLLEYGRHREIIWKSVSSSIVLLMQLWSSGHFFQLESLKIALERKNAFFILLKLLNRNLKEMLNKNSELEDLYPFSGKYWRMDKTSLLRSIRSSDYSSSLSSRKFYLLTNTLYCLKEIVKGSPELCHALIEFKAEKILNKYLEIDQVHFTVYALKLFKSSMRFELSPWRQSVLRIKSLIYFNLPSKFSDEWMNTVRIEDESVRKEIEAKKCLEIECEAFRKKYDQKQCWSLLSVIGCRSDDEVLEFVKEMYPSNVSEEMRNSYEAWLFFEVFSKVAVSR